MIDHETCKAVFSLHERGMSIREMSRQLRMCRRSIRRIIREKGLTPNIIRADKVSIDPELVKKHFADCDGWLQRVHEKLKDDGVEVGYSTLTRMVRLLELGKPADHRHPQVPDQPGVEMQHDTSPYDVKIGEKTARVVASCLYFRYSKQRYLKFYPTFKRFRMKCFFHEALIYFGYSAGVCIIDNTNLAVLHGTGDDAVMVPEMAAFAIRLGFKFKAHARGHSNRKAGEERSFWFVETNFFPGRHFESFEDLNLQALKWSTEIIPIRPQTKSRIIPAQLFEFEKPHLNHLPPFLPPPTLAHQREVDQYGYAAFDGNYFWVPGTRRGTVDIIEYSDKIKIYQNREELSEYNLPPFGTKNGKYPENRKPTFSPRNCKHPTEAEEKRLSALDPCVVGYLELVKQKIGSPVIRYRFVRLLFGLSLKVSSSLFVKTIQRAKQYGVTDFDTIERMVAYLMRDDAFETPLFDLDEDFKNRDCYREGQVTDLPDLSKYDRFMDDEQGNGQGT